MGELAMLHMFMMDGFDQTSADHHSCLEKPELSAAY
jgi:hypothetical protein